MATYLHHVPGRLRVRCPTLKRNTARAAAVTELLAGMEGILNSEVNPLTGSLTLSYDHHRLEGQEIIAFLQANGYCQSQAWTPPPRAAAPTYSALDGFIENTGATLGKMLLGALMEKAVERSAGALIGALL